MLGALKELGAFFFYMTPLAQSQFQFDYKNSQTERTLLTMYYSYFNFKLGIN